MLINFGAQNDPQNEPKNVTNEPRNVTKQTTYSKTKHLQEFSKIMALVFQKISEFLDTIDTFYISSFFVIHPCHPPKMINKCHKKAPRNTPKSDKIHARKNTDFWHRFCFDFDPKNDPKMTPKSTKMAPLGSQGAPWDPLGEPGGPPGASRPILGSNLAPQMSPKPK